MVVESHSVIRNAKNAPGLGRDWALPFFPPPPPPFPSRARFIFALLVLIRSHYTIWEPGTGYPYPYLRVWMTAPTPTAPFPHLIWIRRCRLTLTVKNFQVISNLLFQFIHTISGILVGPRESLNWKNQFPCSLKHSLETFQDLKTCS